MIKVKMARKATKYLIAESLSDLAMGDSVKFPLEDGMQVANFRTAASNQGRRTGKKFSVSLGKEAITITRIS